MKIDPKLLEVDVNVSVRHAFKALALGAANEQQQKLAVDWLIKQACKTYDLSFIMDDDAGRLTAFKEGRRFVGLQIVGLINNPIIEKG